MENVTKMSTLIKPQTVKENELVEGYCGSGYSSSGGSVSCASGYSKTWYGGTSGGTQQHDDDILL